MPRNPQPLIIWGTGGHAVSVLETARASGRTTIVFADLGAPNPSFHGFLAISGDDLGTHLDTHQVVVAIGDNSKRERVVNDLRSRYPHIEFTTLIHPSAIVADSSAIGTGSVVLQGAIVGAYALVGEQCIVNTRASIDHETSVGEFASLAPGTVTGGRVKVGRKSAIGIGATIRHGVSIGSDTIVGSASYVHGSLPDNVVAYGSPAKVVRTRSNDDPYLA